MWQNNLGHCLVKGYFSPGPRELQVSLFQAVILLSFKERDILSYRDLHQKTGMEEKELKRTLQSLACGKVRVLTKSPKVIPWYTWFDYKDFSFLLAGKGR